MTTAMTTLQLLRAYSLDIAGDSNPERGGYVRDNIQVIPWQGCHRVVTWLYLVLN